MNKKMLNQDIDITNFDVVEMQENELCIVEGGDIILTGLQYLAWGLGYMASGAQNAAQIIGNSAPNPLRDSYTKV